MIWVGFFIFWSAVAIAMICLFKSVARHDRVIARSEIFRSMTSREVREYVKNFELFSELGQVSKDDLENLDAAKQVLRERSIPNAEAHAPVQTTTEK